MEWRLPQWAIMLMGEENLCFGFLCFFNFSEKKKIEKKQWSIYVLSFIHIYIHTNIPIICILYTYRVIRSNKIAFETELNLRLTQYLIKVAFKIISHITEWQKIVNVQLFQLFLKEFNKVDKFMNIFENFFIWSFKVFCYNCLWRTEKSKSGKKGRDSTWKSFLITSIGCYHDCSFVSTKKDKVVFSFVLW